MTHTEPAQMTVDGLSRAAELELRWQDERAQRQRASELFHGPTWLDDEVDEDDDDE